MRTTGVKLIAETGLFKREMRESAKETRKVKDEVDDLKTASDKLGEGLAKVGKTVSRPIDEARKSIGELDKQIQSTEKSITALGKSFAKTGDNGILKQIREQQSALKELKNVRSLLPDAEELAKAGLGVGGRLIGGIKSSFASASPGSLGIPALGLLLAPTLGSLVAGAVVGGIGIGGVVGGIALAARNEEVKSAGKELGRFLLGDLQNRASGFVQPTLEAIERIRKGFVDMGPDLDKIFNSSRFVAPLTDGLVEGARGIVSGIADAIDNADPVIYAFRNMFAALGTASGDLFRGMSEDAEEGASAIEDMTMAVTNLITVTGGIMHGTAAVKGFGNEVDTVVDKTRYWLEDNLGINDSLNLLGLQVDMTADGFRRGSADGEAYRKATLGTAEASDFARLKQAGMTDAQIAGIDASGKYRAELTQAEQQKRLTAAQTGVLVAAEGDLKEVQQQATLAQQALTKTIEMLNPAAQRATMQVDALKKATQQLYGAQMQSVESAESFESAWDGLSESVKQNSGQIKHNKDNLDIHTKAGRSNRDALQALLTSSQEMYYADINAGTAIDSARRKHEARTKRIREEAGQLKLNKGETDKLITTYGRIPPKKQTDLVLAKVDQVIKGLMDLYVYQRSLAEGLPIGTVRAMLNNEKGPAKRYGGYHKGGYTGAGGKYEPAGIVHRKEFVIRSESTSRLERENPGVLAEMNATGQLPGHAGGGWVGLAPVESRRSMRFPVETDRTKVPSRAQAASKVTVAFTGGGNWPSGPGSQRGDSGVWRKVVALIKSGPKMGSFGNSYRPGDPKWHGSGRAVDWMGYNMDPLAQFLAARKPLELIHRTNRRDYAYTRGVNKGSFNQSLMNAHRNHIHIAMKNGGMIREPIVGVGKSGATYSFGEGGIQERVTPMGHGASNAGGNTIQITIHNSVATGVNAVEVGRQTAEHLGKYLSAGGTVTVRNQQVLP